MDKRWYPAAMTFVLVGCGGSSFEPGSHAGGAGPANGGQTSVDTGTPTNTGGLSLIFYGPAITGGSSNGDTSVPTGGAMSTGGAENTGGKVNTAGTAATTGGSPAVAYGPITVGGATTTGGKSSVDAGAPSAGGTKFIALYGPNPGGATAGGKTSTANTAVTGGKSSIDAGAPSTGGMPIVTAYGPIAYYGPISLGGSSTISTGVSGAVAPVYGVQSTQ